jgi:hypothetical protein
MLLRVKKTIGLGAAMTLAAVWFIRGSLQNTYVGYPRTPSVQDGRTVAYAVKGIVVYITPPQQDFLSWLDWIELSSGIVAIAVILLHGGDPFRSKK